MKIKKVVVFDLDDTLYNEIDFLKSAFNEIASLIGKEINVDNTIILNELLHYYNSQQNCFKEVIKKHNALSTISDLLDIYRNHIPDLSLAQNRIKVLDYLRNKNIPVCVLTDGRSVQQRNKVEALGLKTYIDEIIISEEFGSEKPNMNNYKYFEDKFGRAQYYYIGDNIIKDFVSPNKLGWTTICLIDNGLNIHSQKIDVPNENYLASYNISAFDEIIGVLDS